MVSSSASTTVAYDIVTIPPAKPSTTLPLMAYSTRDHSVNGYWFWFAHLMVLGQERHQQCLLEISRQVAD